MLQVFNGLQKNKNQEQVNSQADVKTFQSEMLDFNVNIPQRTIVNEQLTFVDLSLDESKINISRNGTNFDNLEDYLKDFDSKRELVVTSSKSTEINEYKGVKRIEEFDVGPVQEQAIIYYYLDGWIYTLTTASKDLYDELDQIARSFRYTP